MAAASFAIDVPQDWLKMMRSEVTSCNLDALADGGGQKPVWPC